MRSADNPVVKRAVGEFTVLWNDGLHPGGTKFPLTIRRGEDGGAAPPNDSAYQAGIDVIGVPVRHDDD